MRRSEMTKKQLEMYERVRERLAGYEFELDDNKWFHKNLTADAEIEGNYDNGDMELVLEFSIKENVFTLWLTDNDSGKEVNLDLYVGKKIEDVMEYIGSMKDKVNAKNFRKYVNGLVKVCPEVYTYRDEKKFKMEPDGE